jgi:protein FAM32A
VNIAAGIWNGLSIVMPASDYTASTGGALKLKGSGGITKHKKKKKPKPPAIESSSQALEKDENDSAPDAERELGDGGEEESTKPVESKAMKTEAELRFEENKKKRLEERLRRDGVKTHKEKVEELNRYLSKLSEHHDMYVLTSYCKLLLKLMQLGPELVQAKVSIICIEVGRIKSL